MWDKPYQLHAASDLAIVWPLANRCAPKQLNGRVTSMTTLQHPVCMRGTTKMTAKEGDVNKNGYHCSFWACCWRKISARFDSSFSRSANALACFSACIRAISSSFATRARLRASRCSRNCFSCSSRTRATLASSSSSRCLIAQIRAASCSSLRARAEAIAASRSAFFCAARAARSDCYTAKGKEEEQEISTIQDDKTTRREQTEPHVETICDCVLLPLLHDQLLVCTVVQLEQ